MKEELKKLLADLNQEQREAVLHTKTPALILAGAGSGKTKVITYKIAYLLASKQTSPDAILALTFTNKAAGEMRDRIMELFVGEVAGLWICTFHALGARLLRIHAKDLNLSSSFSIFDEDDRRKAIKLALKQANVDAKRFSPDVVKAWLDKNKFSLLNPDLSPSSDGESSFLENRFLKIFDNYQSILKENNAVDFNDLLALPPSLFRSKPNVLDHYRRRFRYILVDEYQDTNRAQYHLCRLLAPNKSSNLCVVGDEDQSIYSWRGADIRNILDFERDYPGAKTFHLLQNYRSTEVILEAAGKLISHNSERRKKKELWTKTLGGKPIDYRRHFDGRSEAIFVANKIEDFALSTSGYDLKDIAVFYRVHAQSRAIETELVKRGVPYQVFGGHRFFERKEIKDLLAYLRVMANPLDQISLLRILNVPPRRIGKKTIEAAIKGAQSNDLPLYAFLELSEASGLGKSAKKRLRTLHSFLEDWRDRFTALSNFNELLDLIRAFITDLGYIEYLNASGKEDRIDLVQEFLAAVADPGITETVDSDETASKPLQAFLNQVTLASNQDHSYENSSKVTLMTLHNAKGLEFPVVFLIGLDEGLLPYHGNDFSEEKLEEERRLCYVGFTRARERLFLSSAMRRFLWGRPVSSGESRFLFESRVCGNLAEDNGYFPDEEFDDPFWD